MAATALGRRGLAIAATAGLARPAAAAGPIIGGTGGPLAMARLLVEAHEEAGGASWSVAPSLGSTGGMRALAAGRIALALSLSPPDAGQAPLIESRSFARTPLVLAAHRNCRTESLTATEAARLLAGQVRHWPDGTQARTIFRPPGEQEWRMLRGAPAPLDALATPPPAPAGDIVAATAQDNGRAIAEIEGALGLITLGQILTEQLDLRILRLGGAMPSVQALRDGAWPISIAIRICHRRDAGPEALAFLAFLQSPQARALMAERGYLAEDGAT